MGLSTLKMHIIQHGPTCRQILSLTFNESSS